MPPKKPSRPSRPRPSGSGRPSRKPRQNDRRPGSRRSANERSTNDRPARKSEGVRLQKFLAQAGYGSRRECESLIEEGRVIVDEKAVDQLGTRVDPDKQKVFVDGERVKQERMEYYILNKPPGVVSTSRDPAGRVRVIDLIDTRRRVYNVGRLDKSSEGLILVTNDGELAQRLTHPRYGIPKTYHVQVEGDPDRETLKSLVEGIHLAEGFARMANVKFKRKQKKTTWLEIVLEEGRNREIRRLLAKVGHKVLALRRVAIGPLRLGDLPVGASRRLETREIKALQHAQSSSGKTGRKPQRKPGGRRPPGTGSGERSTYSRTASGTARRSDGNRATTDRRSERSDGERGDKTRSRSAKPRFSKGTSERPRSAKPRTDKPRTDKPRTAKSRSEKPQSEPPRSGKPRFAKPRTDKPRTDKPRTDKPRTDKPRTDKPRSDKPRSEKPRDEKPRSGKPRTGQTGSDRKPPSGARGKSSPPRSRRPSGPPRKPGSGRPPRRGKG